VAHFEATVAEDSSGSHSDHHAARMEGGLRSFGLTVAEPESKMVCFEWAFRRLSASIQALFTE
jgi:hypothetical protein